MKDAGIIPRKRDIIFLNYKEPLKETRHGYLGAISGTRDGALIQCHICGKFYQSLSFHIFHAHSIRAKEYKIKFQLSNKTPIVSENMRKVLKERLRKYVSSLTKEQLKKRIEQITKNRHRTGGRKNRLEHANKRGNCPDQLLDKILEVKESLGHTPTITEFMRETGGQKYTWKIQSVFGTWRKALKKLNLKPTKNPGKGHRQYTDEELLDYLENYWRMNGIPPTSSDSRMGYIPSMRAYRNHFGSLQQARELIKVNL